MRQGVDDEHDWQNVDPSGERTASVQYTEPGELSASGAGQRREEL